MPGEIIRLVRLPVSIVLTETQYKALEALAKAEDMNVDEEISSLAAWSLYACIGSCESMSDEEKHSLKDMLKKQGEN